MKFKLTAVVILVLLGISGVAQASPITDTVTYWSGTKSNGTAWSFATNDTTKYNNKTMNNSDAWGTPDIKGGSLDYTGTKLTGISLTFATDKSEASIWNTVYPGDFFIDLNSDGRWDLVLDNPNMSTPNNTWNVYKVDLEISNPLNYEYSRLSNTATGKAISDAFSAAHLTVTSDYTSSAGIPRYDHPVAIRDALLSRSTKLGTASLTGWASSIASGAPFTISWDLKTLALDMHNLSSLGYSFDSTSSLTYAFAVTCANDVIFGRAPVPNPEPATLLLLGAGTLGTAFLTSRRKRVTSL